MSLAKFDTGYLKELRQTRKKERQTSKQTDRQTNRRDVHVLYMYHECTCTSIKLHVKHKHTYTHTHTHTHTHKCTHTHTHTHARTHTRTRTHARTHAHTHTHTRTHANTHALLKGPLLQYVRWDDAYGSSVAVLAEVLARVVAEAEVPGGVGRLEPHPTARALVVLLGKVLLHVPTENNLTVGLAVQFAYAFCARTIDCHSVITECCGVATFSIMMCCHRIAL